MSLSVIYLSPLLMADTHDDALEQAKKDKEKERWEQSGRKGVPFFGTVSDIGSKDAVGVDLGQ